MKRIFIYLFLVSFCSGLFSQVPNYVPTNGLVAWWPFTGNANDLSGNGNNGTVNGATLTTDRFGVVNNAFGFNNNSRIKINFSSTLTSQTGTISGWIFVNSFPPTNNPQDLIFGKSLGYPQILIRANGKIVLSTMINISSSTEIVSNATLNPGVWYHFVGIYSSSNFSLYLNGVLDNSITPNPTPNYFSYCNSEYWVGGFNHQGSCISNDNYQNFDGKIDDLGVWNRVLNICEIQEIHQGTLLNSTITPQSSTTFCQGGSVNLTASQGSTYLWSNGQTTQSISATTSGSYTVQVTDANGCVRTSAPTVVTVNPNPQVTISSTGQTTFCSGGTVTLSSTGGSSYQWSNNQSGNSISVNSSGSFYTIGTDANGCTDTSNAITVIVNPNPQVSISNNGSTTFCQGGSVTLTSTGATSYQWSNNQSGNSISVNTSGSYYSIGSDNNGCIDTSNAITVQANPLPTVVSSNTGPYCEGDNLMLNSSGGVSYSWTGPNGFSSTNQSPQLNNLSISMGGQYQVSSTDINGCIGNSSTLVVVNPKPTLTTGNPQSVCQGQTISLTSTGGSTYQWSGVNGFTSTNQNPTIPNSDLTMSGQYQVVGFNSFGCSDTGFINVVVNPLPVITSSGGGVFCSGSNVSLSSTGGQTYTWSGPNGFMSTQQNPVLTNVTQSMSGNYVVTGTDMNGCSSSSTLTMNVVSGPVVTTQPQNQTVGVPGPATFSIVSSDPNALFQWQTDLGVGFQNLTNSGQYSGVNTNTLTVNNVSFNNNNQQFRCIISTTSCSDTSDVGILFVDDSMTLEGQSEETIKIYPNPTQTDFTIEVPVSLLGEQFVVLDNLGRVVLKDDIRSTNQQISIQHLSRGTYVIKVNRFNQILILN